MDWMVSDHVLMASITASWLLRTVFRTSSCRPWVGVLAMCFFLLLASCANFTKRLVGVSSRTLGKRSSNPRFRPGRYPKTAPGTFRWSGSFEDGGDALAAADAHGGEGVPAAGAPELVERLDGQDCPGRADRMTEREAAAVRVDAFRRQPEFPGYGQGLGGEGLVHLEDVDLVQLEAGPVEDVAGGRNRAHAHDPRLHAGVAHTGMPDRSAQTRVRGSSGDPD